MTEKPEIDAEPVCLLGAHLSIARGLDQALYEASSLDCTALQVFTKNANTWKERMPAADQIDRFHRAIAETGISHIAAHTSYLINLAAPDRKKHEMSCNALARELIRSSELSIPYVVLHPGSHMGQGDEKAIERITDSINRIFSDTPGVRTRLLIETTAGQGSSVGHTFEQIASIVDRIENRRQIGVCLDTSHIFAAGYDIRGESDYRGTVQAFDRIVGLERLFLIHLNDSKKGLASRVDRHAHIGKGEIGLEAFRCIMNDPLLNPVPKVIETPKEDDWDRLNLAQLRQLISQKTEKADREA